MSRYHQVLRGAKIPGAVAGSFDDDGVPVTFEVVPSDPVGDPFGGGELPGDDEPSGVGEPNEVGDPLGVGAGLESGVGCTLGDDRGSGVWSATVRTFKTGLMAVL